MYAIFFHDGLRRRRTRDAGCLLDLVHEAVEMSDIAKAKAALLRALDQLEQAEADLGSEPDRVDLVVIYTIGRDDGDAWDGISGWSSTAGPKWLHAAMLRRAADALEDADRAVDDEPEDDG